MFKGNVCFVGGWDTVMSGRRLEEDGLCGPQSESAAGDLLQH